MNKDYFLLKNKFNTTKIAKDVFGINDCVSSAKKMIEESVSDEEKVSLYYSIATAYSDLARLVTDNENASNRDELITQSFIILTWQQML